MRHVLSRAVVAVVAGSALLTGCTSTVVGTASPGDDVPSNVAADAFPITGATDNDIDNYVRNALVDLNTFWSEAYREFYGGDLPPLAGGYFSVDSQNIDSSAYPPTGIGCQKRRIDPSAVEGNAFYTSTCDLIAYDRALLAELSDSYGRALGPVVLAHEFGHAIQGRVGYAESGRSIQDETQADCFAGAWSAWVTAGHAEHVSIRVPELDGVINGFLLLRDPVGEDPDADQAHGSYFDRVSAFSDGYAKGVGECRDKFGEDRVFTAAEFTDRQDYQNEGNAPYNQILQIIDDTLPPFWQQIFPAAFGKDFEPPKIASFDKTAPDCGGMANQDRDLGFCPSDKTVYFDASDLAKPAYDELGDFAVATAVSLPYSLAVREQLGRSTDDAAATESAVCLTGWYSAQLYNGAFADSAQITLSPGDIDEAVQFLLEYGGNNAVFPNTDLSGFELLQAYRAGFLDGGTACDVGL